MLDLQIHDVSVSDNLNDGFFIREGGLNIRSNLSDGVQAYRNSLVLILQILQLENRRLLLPHQVHGGEVLVVTLQNIDDYSDQAKLPSLSSAEYHQIECTLPVQEAILC